jgi:hypothetical protein
VTSWEIPDCRPPGDRHGHVAEQPTGSLTNFRRGSPPISGLARVFVSAVSLLCVFALALIPIQARAEDLSRKSRAWNGLSDLFTLARASGPVEAPERIDVDELLGSDSLLLVHPQGPLPREEFAKFLHRGGRLAVADDFGAGRELFTMFGMTLSAPPPDAQPVLRHNPNLLLATPLLGHALADGVPALVTNHPQVLRHHALTPVFALLGRQDAIVLSGAVGDGRLIAISDASLFINNMLEFSGNRAFARNLLRFLRGAGGSRLFIADSETHWQGGLRRLAADHPFAQLSAALARLAKPQLPPNAVLALSIGLAGLLLITAFTSLPKRSAYARRAYLQNVDCQAGMAGRIDHYAAPDRNLLAPLLVLKLELEHRMVARARLTGSHQRGDVLRILREQGLSRALSDELAGLLAQVDRLEAANLATRTSRVGSQQFSELVASGRRILAGLDSSPVT